MPLLWQQVDLVSSSVKQQTQLIQVRASIVYQQGAKYANGEFIQIHPTAIPGDDKLRLMR